MSVFSLLRCFVSQRVGVLLYFSLYFSLFPRSTQLLQRETKKTMADLERGAEAVRLTNADDCTEKDTTCYTKEELEGNFLHRKFLKILLQVNLKCFVHVI